MAVRSTWSKSELLARGVDLRTWVPLGWPGGYTSADGCVGNLNLPEDFEEMKCRFPGKTHFHYYPSIMGRLREYRPDLLHIDEEPYSLVTYQLVRAARRLGIKPVVFTWQNIHKRYPPPFCWMERYVLENAAGLIGGNEESIEVFRRKGFAGPTAVIPQFGVDEGLFSLTNAYAESDTLRLVFAGRFVPEKGVDTVFEAMRILPWVTLDMIGAGPAEASWRTQAAACGVGDRVRFTGPLASMETPAKIATYDVLILPSRTRANWKEQFGRVLVESMASGTPAVGSSSGEIPRLINEPDLVFAEGSAEALMGVLCRIRSSAVRRTLGEAARVRARCFTQSVIVGKTLDFYGRVHERVSTD